MGFRDTKKNGKKTARGPKLNAFRVKMEKKKENKKNTNSRSGLIEIHVNG